MKLRHCYKCEHLTPENKIMEINGKTFCVSCLENAFHRLENKKRNKGEEELRMGIKRFLKKKGITPWLKN